MSDAAVPPPNPAWARRQAQVMAWTGLEFASIPQRLNRELELVAIVASHLRRHPEWSSVWRDRLQRALMDCRQRDAVVVYSLDSPIGFWIREFAKQLEVPAVAITILDTSADHWTKQTDASSPSSLNISLRRSQAELHAVDMELSKLPLHDRVLMSLADQVYAIAVRKNSKTEKLLGRWLDEPRAKSNRGNVIVDDASLPIDSPVRSKEGVALCQYTGLNADNRSSRNGLRDWNWHCAVRQMARGVHSSKTLLLPRRLVQRSRWNSDDFLIHCTRGRTGRFPLQTKTGYVTEMLLEDQDVDVSPWQTLRQILSDRRVVATPLLKRGNTLSVSFSNVPLLELLERRCFQRHLQRYDWEPYGLGIRKSVLMELHAAQPVVYVDRDTTPARDKQWLTQPSKSSDNQRRWSDELEWRTPNDVRFASLAFGDAFVFVPTRREAIAVAQVSPFPIAIVQDE